MDKIREVFEKGGGILQLLPTWVPRPFNRPGKRLRLHPDDYFAMGMDRGAIVERWFSSITHVETEGARPDEGMSYVNVDDTNENKILFKDFIDELKEEIIGSELIEKYGTWPMYSKFYDYEMPLFHHIHHGEEACKKVGVKPKFEHYYFPKQYNQHLGQMPVSYFGFDPSVTKEEVIERLKDYTKRDIRITELSRAFRIELDTGWYTPAGVVHAPGSLCTYEPQWNSDAMAMWENVVNGEVFGYDSLCAYLPEEDKNNIEKIVEVADWEINTAPDYRKRFFRRPVIEQKGEGYEQRWIVYGNEYVGGKQLEVEPAHTVVIKDDCAYGCVVIQGHGTFGKFECESPTMIRYGQATADEFFVSKDCALKGVVITNKSKYEPLVILKHFGPDGNILPVQN
ncbi:hypothetical protein [Bacteroides sp. 51]|uniref:hypothetical protein n=1 Tax=Bacteroides sp. 51 TaxID=2302938 RepID=UPI0013D1BED5|nr:hypothetical protein [Bacteroides sp. 51]NDV81595.1 hypothetical protein [Bacteroides sp. 51]